MTSVDKWHHYFDIYDAHFKQFQGKNPVILEIGVQRGGSLEMWNYYFDNQCTIYGVDIDKTCKELETTLPNVKQIFIGDQADPEFWKKVKEQMPKVDILIDDGGHFMKQQIVTFECMYEWVTDNGVYLCEDLHTSYWSDWGGALKKPTTFIEYSKNFVDMLNAYHVAEVYPKFNDLTFRKMTNSIHYYDSVIVLQKKVDNVPPTCSRRY